MTFVISRIIQRRCCAQKQDHNEKIVKHFEASWIDLEKLFNVDCLGYTFVIGCNEYTQESYREIDNYYSGMFYAYMYL